MKKPAVAMILLLVFLCVPIPLWADIIIEPFDPFWYSHQSECGYHARSYTVTSAEGQLAGRSSPESAEIVGYYPNGQELFVWYIYESRDGLWGLVEPAPGVAAREIELEYFDGTFSSCWVPLGEMTVVYDATSFWQEHEAEIREYTGSSDDLRLLNWNQFVPYWQWPGYREEDDYLSPYTMEEFSIRISYVYRDPQGREWGYAYFPGTGGGWFYLSDPLNTDLDVNYNPATGGPRESAGRGPSLPTLSIALVAGTALLSGILIRVFWGGKDKMPRAEK